MIDPVSFGLGALVGVICIFGTSAIILTLAKGKLNSGDEQ